VRDERAVMTAWTDVLDYCVALGHEVTKARRRTLG
jgi:hypothetical protein